MSLSLSALLVQQPWPWRSACLYCD